MRTGANGLVVQYERLQRSSAPSELQVEAASSLVRGASLRIRMDQALVDGMEIDSVVPEPVRVEAGAGYTAFVFAVAPGEGARVRFRYRPATFGRCAGLVAVAGTSVRVDQFIYP